ncbi:phenazine biosynthesis protein [Fusarium avenaceum]|nr:phenazine biosynthesis protein [Fusarium avenaceum]
MAPEKLFYRTLDVFTNARFKGNQVAIVEVGDTPLSPVQMQMIAREFNFSETVFLHRNSNGEIAIKIYTPQNEINFAGHPVIGTGHAIFGRFLPSLKDQKASLTTHILTNAGPVELKYDPTPGFVTAEVPHNIHIHHHPTTLQQLVETQPGLKSHLSTMQPSFPAISIVKGVTYTLADFSSHPEIFLGLEPGPSQTTELDDGWSPSFTGAMYYIQSSPYKEDDVIVQRLRVRMIAINLEDPACGSGSCALSVYLALQKGGSGAKFRFLIEQGKEIGRDSSIKVDVILNDQGTGVAHIFLAGQATPVMEGTLLLPN